MLWSYKKILVAVEDEQIADHICNYISDQFWPADTEFRLVHVVQPQPDEDAVRLAESIKQSTKYGQFVLDKCARSIADSVHAPVGESITLGYVIEQIKEEIENWNPDLLIVGSHGRSTIGKWFFGSVSEVLLSQVSCPVLVIRPPKHRKERSVLTAKKSWSKIVIAVEDNSQSRLLIDQIISHKWENHTVFTILHVIDKDLLHESGPFVWESVREREVAKANVFVKTIADRIKRMLPSAEVHEAVIVGTPAKEVLEYTSRSKVDLLIAGSHGRNNIAKGFLGSVSEPLLSKAQSAVVVIRPAKAKAKAKV